MTPHQRKVIVGLLVSVGSFANCVKIPELAETGTDVQDVVSIDQGPMDATTSAPDGDGSSASTDADVQTNTDANVADDGDGFTSDGSASDGAMDVNGGCSGAGMLLCGGACINSQTNAAHCGMCGNACPMAMACVAGECRCDAVQVFCGGSCVNTQSNSNHCGRCGNSCPAGINCVGGVCLCPMMGQVVCAGSCVSTQSSNAHCGMCGNACAAGQTCTGGSCQCPMATPQLCAGTCVNTTNNNMHCGACGMACAAGRSCVAGMCQCNAGTMLCGGSCVNTNTDTANCGACGRACGATQSCVAGVCACPAPQRDCAMNGVCVDLGANANNCGRCGNVCPVPANSVATCSGGACSSECMPGFADCDGNAANGCEVDLNTSAANCGTCGTQCIAGACVAGACSQWARQGFDGMGNGGESGLDAAEDANGNVYFVGYGRRELYFGSTRVPVSNTAGYIVSYTPTGRLRWFKVIDALFDDYVNSVSVKQIAGQTRVLIAGNATGPVNLGEGSMNYGSSFFAEYDQDGRFQWATSMLRPGVNPSLIGDTAIGPGGEVYISGTSGTFTIQGMESTNPQLMNFSTGFLMKLDAMGNYVWTRWVRSLQDASDGKAVAVDSVGNVIWSARIDAVVDVGGGARGTAGQQDDMLLAKFDSNNQHLWSGVYGVGNLDQSLQSIVINPFNDNITIAGHFGPNIDFGAGPVPFVGPFVDTFIANFRAAGVAGRPDFIASRTIGAGAFGGDDAPATLFYTSDARLFVFDNYREVSIYAGFPVPNVTSGRRPVIAELNPSTLAVLSAVGFNSDVNSINVARGATGCGEGFVCLTGVFNPNIRIGTANLVNSGFNQDYDVFFARIARP